MTTKRPSGTKTRTAAHRSSGRRSDAVPLARTTRELTRTARRTVELATVSAETIGHRTAMMVKAAGDPVALSNPEFTLMVREKVEAFARAFGAVGGGFQVMQGIWMAAAVGQSMATAQAMAALAACRTPEQVVAVQRRYIEAVTTDAAAAGSRFVHAAAEIAGSGLLPVHKVAAANAKRLGRKR
jgi:hypothetical protein